ncbi:MAG: site-2 protease family protein [Anaerolineae bacterium]|nr:site-2 protease family protein [Thermoflexales bacterium]MDW8407824.1 site-2 protease family protein [Anaerolineae bacterium]
MGWSFKIAEISGIPIRVHVTFFLILVLGAVQWGGITGTAEGALFGIILMVLLFTCVTLHELGHSIAARAFGIPVRDITLLPLGGVAQITKNPEKPIHELIIAAAGPLVNVVIAAVLFVAVGASMAAAMLDGQGLLPAGLNQPSLETLLFWLLAANISLVLFNLIPAFPLDGGRMLRAVLAMGLGYPRATRIASTIGQVIAIGLGLFGFLSGNFILVLIAVFVFFGAGQETAMAESKTVLRTRRVGDTYNRHAITLNIGDRVSRVVDYLLTSYQPDFAVMQGSRPIGIITRADVLRSLSEAINDAYVTEIMRRDFVKVEADRPLDEVQQIMAEHNQRVVAVYEGDHFLGLVSIEDISEAFTILSFMQRQQEARLAGAGR